MKGFLNLFGKISFNISLIISIIIDFQIIWHEWAYRGLVLSFLAFPLAFLGIPIFALIKYGRWLPLIITYGGGLLSFLLIIWGDENDSK